MPYLSKESVIFTPDGGNPVALVAYDGLVEEQVSLEPTVSIQRDAIYRRPWIRQAARGGASLSMSFTVARAFETRAEAEIYGIALQRHLLLHPVGTVSHRYAYDDDDLDAGPGREDTYLAALDTVRPYPINSDHLYGDTYYSGKAVWLAIAFQITLTLPSPAPDIMAYKNDPTSGSMPFTRNPAAAEFGFWAGSRYIIRGGTFNHAYRIKSFHRLALHPTGPIVVTRASGTEICRSTLLVPDGEMYANTRGPFTTYTVYLTHSDDIIAAADDIYLTFPGDPGGNPEYLCSSNTNFGRNQFALLNPANMTGPPISGQIDAIDATPAPNPF